MAGIQDTQAQIFLSLVPHFYQLGYPVHKMQLDKWQEYIAENSPTLRI